MRLFIAIELPPDLKGEIAEAFSHLRSLGGGWASEGSIHLTLAFLGEQSAEVLGDLETALRSAVNSTHPFDASLDSAGFFPHRRRPRVGWLGVESGGKIEGLATSVRRAAESVQVTFDPKPFSSHLTLVRFRDGRWSDDELDRFEKAAEGMRGLTFPVASVIVYESALQRGGAVHSPRLTVPLH
jgi:2'-5' RNA ligase